MRKKLLLTLCLVAANLFAQEQLPQWASDIQTLNPGLVDSILYYNASPAAPNTRTYVIYYNQPLNHSQSGSAHFPLRALITVNTNGNPTTAVNHVYASGYSIMGAYLEAPDSVFAAEIDCANEIARRYNGNFIQIEHRYFQHSAPAQCWTNLDDLRAEEAAADFHNFFEALKKVLKGKYVMSGVSKGGVTTLLQHRFYPNDMDIFVPYSAPFFDSDRDSTLEQYWFTHGWNQYYRDLFLTIAKNGISRKDSIFPVYLKMQGPKNTQAAIDSTYLNYLSYVTGFGYEEHAYGDTASIRLQMYRNDSIMQAKGVQYGDTVYAYMFDAYTFSLDSFPKWIDTLRKYPEPNQAPVIKRQHRHVRPFGVTYDEWWSDTVDARAYEYQAKCELGYYDCRFDHIIDSAALAAEFNNYWKQHAGCLLDLQNPCYRSLTYSPALYNATMTATQNATKPILLIYGLDDAWTGGAVKDQFINGSNVKKFILPAQNHKVAFSSNTDQAMCDAIRSALDAVLGTPQGLEEVRTENKEPRAEKVILNGQLYILRAGKTYDALGREVK